MQFDTTSYAKLLVTCATLTITACSKNTPTRSFTTLEDSTHANADARLLFPGERHFKNIQQLTTDGENAEAYFNGDGSELIFQATREGFSCDQIFRMDADGKNKRLVSTGEGRTTCSYLFPNQPKILYSSTHAELKTCPPKPDFSRGYVWRLQPELDIYIAGPEGEHPSALAPHPGYDAEGVISPAGDRIVFTSTRSGDVDIFSMNPDGTDVQQLTTEIGYDGGAFFSPDGKKIVYRAHHPTDQDALAEYKSLLADDLVRPSIMELFVMDADGKNKRQLTDNGAANFAPYFHPSGDKIIFSSNMDDPRGRNFDLYMIGVDGKHLERLTYNPSFDSFPMFSYDGTRVVFASNRNARREGDTNVFIADWVEAPAPPLARSLRGPAALDTLTTIARVDTLSSEPMQGRGLGTQGIELAANYIIENYKTLGLVAPDGMPDYRQVFETYTSSKVKTASVKFGEDALSVEEFTPLEMSANAATTAEAIFVGYGITAPEHQYDDYEGVDISGKIAVVLSGAPHDAGKHDAALDDNVPSRHSSIQNKIMNARDHGAVGIIVVNDPKTYGRAGTREDKLIELSDATSPDKIIAVQLLAASASKLFGATPVPDLQHDIDKSKKPKSGLKLGDVTLEVELERTKTETANLVGRLPANPDGQPTDYALVIGAHYDHIGKGGSGSLRPGSDTWHHGADDNASGVALMLELAEALAATPRQHDVYVVAFSAEESGLLGSQHFVTNAPIATTQMLAMLNFDMVGRLRDDKLTLAGVGSATQFLDLARRAQTGTTLDLALSFEGYGPSDHMSFYMAKVPVLAFHTGLHNDYHTPDDTPDKINVEGIVEIGVYAHNIASELLSSSRRPTYAEQQGTHQGDHSGRSHRDYGPYFGSIPGFGQDGEVNGALMMGTKPGSPAEKAGLKKGDVMIKFDGAAVTGLRDFAFALRKKKPGDVVEIVVLRGGEEVTLTATLSTKEEKQ